MKTQGQNSIVNNISTSVPFIIAFLAIFIHSNSVAQTYVDPRATETDLLSLAVVQDHLNDSFYLQMRPLPGVRVETRDYILRNDGNKWTATFRNKCRMSGGCALRSQKIKASDADARTCAQNIDFGRLLGPISDSLSCADPGIIGGTSYFIIVCSKGKVRKLEYPFNFHYNKTNKADFWQSNYVESVFRDLEKLSKNAKPKHR